MFKFSLFVYIPKSRYQDHKALDGGEEGLKVVREVLSVCRHILKPKG
jgi:methylase of polypeptide subunit release factors